MCAASSNLTLCFRGLFVFSIGPTRTDSNFGKIINYNFVTTNTVGLLDRRHPQPRLTRKETGEDFLVPIPEIN